jgi:CheY-like chemotaxis protein
VSGLAQQGRRPAVTRIAAVRPQQRVIVSGTVRSAVAEGIGTSPAIRCVIADGSGEIALVFLGHQGVAGLMPGRRCTAEGTACVHRGHLVIWNPRYELQPADTPDEGEAAGRRLVVIDDDPGLCEIIEINLARRGYRVNAAATAVAALSPELRGADLVIVDIGLARAAGIKTITMIRDLSAAPIITISAHNDEAVRRAVITVGANDFLVKPFPIEALLGKVATLLDYRRSTLISPALGG